MRTTSFRFLALLLIVIACGACASYQQQPSAVEQARLAYVDAALAYDVAWTTIVDLRGTGAINNEQWARFKAAEAAVRTYAPMVRAALDLWKQTGTEPATFNSSLSELTKAFAEVAAVKEGRP